MSPSPKPHVILIHGLSRTPLSMLSLGRFLHRHGFETSTFGYAAFAERYEGIVRRLRDRFHQLAGHGPFAVVAHSMGAVLTRSALAEWDGPKPYHVVMLGPPNRPPRLASHAVRWPPWRWLSGQSGRNLADATFYDSLPPLPVPYTIIAGTAGWAGRRGPFSGEPNDGVVAVSETRLDEADQVREVRTSHTLMMFRGPVKRAVLDALSGSGTG